MSRERVLGTLWGFNIGFGVMSAVWCLSLGRYGYVAFFLCLVIASALANYTFGAAKGEME